MIIHMITIIVIVIIIVTIIIIIIRALDHVSQGFGLCTCPPKREEQRARQLLQFGEEPVKPRCRGLVGGQGRGFAPPPLRRRSRDHGLAGNDGAAAMELAPGTRFFVGHKGAAESHHVARACGVGCMSSGPVWVTLDLKP